MDLASSVASLIGLAGLAVQSASTFYTFCHKIPRVAGEVEAIVNEIQRLNQTLESIRHVIDDRTAQKLSPRTNGVIAKLQDQVKQCTTDLEAWNKSVTALKMRDGKWSSNAVKKLKLAADAGRFLEMRGKISAHRDQLTLLVELLNVYEVPFDDGEI
jgi:signal transduction protein with GAF and PtsI domain